MAPSLDLFISHSSVDADLVEPLVDLLQDALALEPERIRATTIDGYRLPAGIPFEEALRRETHDAIAFIGLISPASLTSSYVAFELGSRWGARRHLVPLLAPEVAAGALQGPLSGLNAIKVDDRAQLQQLIADLAAELGKTARAPHQYTRQLDKLLAVAAGRGKSLPRRAPLSDAEASGSEVDYFKLVEYLEVLRDLQRRFVTDPADEIVAAELEKAEDPVRKWIRANRVHGDPEIVNDAEELLEMFREERQAVLNGSSIAWENDPREVFRRLVQRVRSNYRN